MFGEEGFQKFYRANLKLRDGEYKELLETLKQPLPKTFRSLRPLQNIEAAALPLLFDSGFIYSQELVSTLPCKLMQLDPTHTVLDMCAAPGSKSTQMAQHVRLLVANEARPKRCNVLINNLKKTPTTNVVVTNHDACFFPRIRLQGDVPGCGERGDPLLFDRILCDVPCSSDGTVRKDRKILENWRLGTGLFELQLRILKRAARLLKADGSILYSTCSLNPIENEAVVQQFCSDCFFEVADCTGTFDFAVRRVDSTGTYADAEFLVPGDGTHPRKLSGGVYRVTKDHRVVEIAERFIFREGLTDWNPFLESNDRNRKFFPSGNTDLRNCLRVMPHDQDTGGFFIAVLRRRGRQVAGGGGSCAPRGRCWAGDEKGGVWRPKFRRIDDALSAEIRGYYGLGTDDVFVTQSKIVRAASPAAFSVSTSPGLIAVSVGVKAFEENRFAAEERASYRISYEYAQLEGARCTKTVALSEKTLGGLLDGLFHPLDTEAEGYVVFLCGSLVLPGFVSRGKGVLFASKEIRAAMCGIVRHEG